MNFESLNDYQLKQLIKEYRVYGFSDESFKVFCERTEDCDGDIIK